MIIGTLNKRVTIQAPASSASDGAGGTVAAAPWVDLATVWASISPLIGRELLAAQAVQAETSHRVTIRFRSGVSAKCRILLGTRVFRVVAPPRDTDERHRELVLDCAEVIGEAV
jgi:SPP1 family predicted phage head-tail adaptor